MSNIGWIIFLILIIPAVGLLLWVLLASSFIRIPSGQQGLLLVRGRATDVTLGPGVHFVPALRRRMVERYPAIELSYRAGAVRELADRSGLDCTGPAIPVVLGDLTAATVSATVRFRLIPETLRLVHDRYGPAGIFGIVRDETVAALRTVLGSDGVEATNLFVDDSVASVARVTTTLTDRLRADGVELTALLITGVDLGRSGEVIQAISRARLERDYETVSAATRLARARNDAQLAAEPGVRAAWRYREAEVWPELARDAAHLHLSIGDRPPTEGLGARTGSGAEDPEAPESPA